MIFSVEINNQTYKSDAENPFDISIPLDFNGAQPNAFGVERAASEACETGAFVGDTRRGGSCNFERVTFVPHCNGTHTESIGHVTRERISVRDCLKDAFILSSLVSVEPESALESNETYPIELNENDRLITRKSLETALQKIESIPHSAFRVPRFNGLIVRTLPNDAGKTARDYMKNPPAFFSTEAMNYIVESGVKHLLVDMPSIDRAFDEGKLSNHRIFWNVEPKSFETSENSFINNSITEMIYAPDEVADGFYLLNLQIAPFAADAAPSRPVLFEIVQ